MRYRGSVLGILWSLLLPLGTTFVIAFVFATIWDSEITSFVPYLFSGLTPWNFLMETLGAGTTAYIGAEGYIKQIPVDLEIFPVRVAASAFVNMLFGLLAYFLVILVLNPVLLTWNTFMIIPALLYFFLLAIASTTIAAIANTYIRDYAPMQTLILQTMFYLTPIIYDISMMKERGLAFIYEFNPFYYFLQIMRDAMMGVPPQGGVWLIAIAILTGMLTFALVMFNKTKKRIIFKL